MIRSRFSAAVLSAAAFISLSGCHSYHIDTTIENRSGGVVKLLEVDYPFASFGTDSIAAGADYHYRFQVEGSGPLTIEYTTANGHAAKATGPNLAQGQEGRLQIVLLPEAKVEFQPELRPKS